MWNARRSLLLSKICVLVFMAALAAALIAGPWLVSWLIGFSANAHQQHTPWFLATLYSGGVFAGILLVQLYRLLHNIGQGGVFTAKNISLLRGISWCCFAGAFICLFSAIYYLPWGAVAVAAAFIGLIVRVVKNVLAQALALKEENDYTI
ncbi:MAG: DUF2975 domain-containing protein [Ruminococcaceae bacterium]|nr:DUF2975 domain-containing protein [Oscillospiraceae bacterium]